MTKRKVADQVIKVDARHISREGQEDSRRRGLEMLKAGISQTQVARNLGVHRQCVIRWKKRLEQFDFEEAVKNEKRGPKPGRDNKRNVLTNDQRRTICETILEKNPAELNLEFSLWTTKLILSLIKNKFQIDINQRTLCSYLNVWGFTVQRPEKPAIQIKWLENQYPDVKRKAKTEKALIYWVDAAEIQQGNRLNQYSSTVKEEPIPLFHNEDATKAPTMISAVNNQGKIYFKIEKRALDAENCLGFLEALLHDNAGRKIFVITGIPLIQQAKAISQWVETHKEKIELYLLPINPPVES